MRNQNYNFQRDLFEVENARNLTTMELVKTFVPTKNFWRLLSAKNQIILGARGSGKTALAKMLTHNHLAKLKNRVTREMIQSRSFIGMYIPAKVEWVGALKNKPWQTEEDMELYFQWRLNLASCFSFLITLRSCLNSYYEDISERIILEKKIVRELSKDWSFSEFYCDSIKTLEEYLEKIEFEKEQQITKRRVLGALDNDEKIIGISFETDLFLLLKRAISVTSQILDISQRTTWLLCIDEAEFLLPMHHRILNSILRSHSGNLFFKITTMPYCHYTLETNTLVPLNVGHDFEYVYIDQDENLLRRKKKNKNIPDLIDTIFNKRSKASGPKYNRINLDTLLGSSKLLDYREWDFSENSEEMLLLMKYGSESTIKRAFEFLESNNKSAFRDQIGRKIKGMLYLKDAVENLRGNKKLDIYSGVSMAISCGDGNPRRLISIFNHLLKSVNWHEVNMQDYTIDNPIIKPSKQTEILTSVSYRKITSFQSEEKIGPELYKLIMTLGESMKKLLHEKSLGTDQVSSIEIDSKISDELWQIIKRAVGLGLLYHNINLSNPDQLPEKEGTFRMAYVLSPYFRLLPRKGDSRKLNRFTSIDSQLKLF